MKLIYGISLIVGMVLLGDSSQARPSFPRAGSLPLFNDSHKHADPSQDIKNHGFFGAMGRKIVRSHVSQGLASKNPKFIGSRISTDPAYKHSVFNMVDSLHKEGKLPSKDLFFMKKMLVDPKQLENGQNVHSFINLLKRY